MADIRRTVAAGEFETFKSRFIKEYGTREHGGSL
jgi:hypothetical protein